MKRIRLANETEIDSIKDRSDLDVGCNVIALDTVLGTGFAVRRVCNEIDPVISPDGWNLRQRVFFMRDLETMMAAQGVTHYYFNVGADEQLWINTVTEWGAEQVSTKPEYRFKKLL